MRLRRRALLGTLPLLPAIAEAQGLGGGDPAFDDLVRQLGGIAEISPVLLRAVRYEFDLSHGSPARAALVRALGTGALASRIAAAPAAMQDQVKFITALLYTGEVTRNGVTTADYYPWCLAWNALSFAKAPGLCGGPEFGHWAQAPAGVNS